MARSQIRLMRVADPRTGGWRWGKKVAAPENENGVEAASTPRALGDFSSPQFLTQILYTS